MGAESQQNLHSGIDIILSLLIVHLYNSCHHVIAYAFRNYGVVVVFPMSFHQVPYPLYRRLGLGSDKLANEVQVRLNRRSTLPVTDHCLGFHQLSNMRHQILEAKLRIAMHYLFHGHLSCLAIAREPEWLSCNSLAHMGSLHVVLYQVERHPQLTIVILSRQNLPHKIQENEHGRIGMICQLHFHWTELDSPAHI